MSGDITEAENYYSKDFEWEQLRLEVETDPTFLYHLLPFNSDGVSNSTTDSSNSSPLEDSDAWNKFHSRHSTGKFFKERRYLLKEFPELACRGHSKVLEVGCGNGSTALPILRATENSVIYACDCSNEALDRAKENISAANLTTAQDRFHPFLCDVSTFEFPKWLACISCQERFMTAGETQYSLCSEERTCCIGGVDLVTLVCSLCAYFYLEPLCFYLKFCWQTRSLYINYLLLFYLTYQIFTLSALPLHRMTMAIKQCFSVLKPGGILLFRDYGNMVTKLEFNS
ncbi:OLC1v1026492C5 [Oldenlandia corymbosa var. corymbosa]|uniref:OLC1v1026492C5 n=1 Tax=Oldenlandia corymbosa var. corymbosa TaxID=529605 RepID=A0AAV1CA65_OLDCO|nr:OLC1v1026492C5 [Oldenlandia corymbosa var. corymbosa]